MAVAVTKFDPTPSVKPNLHLQLGNHTQKDVFSLTLECIYLDEDGHRLKESVLTHPAPRSVGMAGGMDFPILRAQQQGMAVGVSDVQAPPAAKSVTVSVKRVLFMDATAWPP